MSDDETYARGMQTRRDVLGDEHVDRATERTTAFTAAFQEFITRYAWGDVWSRPGLDRRTRSCVTLAALVATGRERELDMHVRAALRNEVTRLAQQRGLKGSDVAALNAEFAGLTAGERTLGNRTANIEIAHGYIKAAAEVGKFFYGLQPLPRFTGKHGERRSKQIAKCFFV